MIQAVSMKGELVELVAAANAYEGRTDQSGWLMLEQAVWKNRAQSTGHPLESNLPPARPHVLTCP